MLTEECEECTCVCMYCKHIICKTAPTLVSWFHVSTGAEWTVLSEHVADSCYVVEDLPRGASYVFRVGRVTKTGAGPFSDASAPVVMATDPEGKRNAVSYWTLSFYDFTSLLLCSFWKHGATAVCVCYTEIHIPLIQTESLGSKVIGSEQAAHKNYNFLSEINRWDIQQRAAAVQ